MHVAGLGGDPPHVVGLHVGDGPQHKVGLCGSPPHVVGLGGSPSHMDGLDGSPLHVVRLRWWPTAHS